ncbi:DUF4255 domain-containing protein [Mucilaginibacter pocheonensis]|uniref:Pvc16 N-terminal domain-containing protein n=1 Tax=Mucilaginibacter pocheonensis TaxID=398050 RepID=A0ABU1T665_9SPHI|nr:DUF4255 domain-containing protein [Mucilaginibacter pocheonensis]MDR6940881.1 hypothetical protein [Mucilaginibacter pocheonensis]
MSTALAIASVTHVLKDLLNNGVIDRDITGVVGGNVVVTALAPDKIDTSTNEHTQLNLFMYQVSPNVGWTSQELPSRNSSGDLISNPPLALDLYYLLSAYGTVELHTEILLGYGMQLFHENPILSKSAIKNSLSPPLNVTGNDLPANLKALSTSELDQQTELIKITPQALTVDELSKLWTAFQAKYRPTAAYKITVVLIESKRSFKASLPVKDRNIYVLPFKHATIYKLLSQKTDVDAAVEGQKILPGYNLVLQGASLYADNLTVKVDEFNITPDSAKVTDSLITVKLPAELKAGVHAAQVMNTINMGTPEMPHKGFTSNSLAFILSPQIVSVTANNITGAGNAPRAADIVLNIEPALDETQKVILMLNEIPADLSKDAAFYSFLDPVLTIASPFVPIKKITFKVKGVKAGKYLVRLQIDGAESPLTVNGAGVYDTPNIVLP